MNSMHSVKSIKRNEVRDVFIDNIQKLKRYYMYENNFKFLLNS